jgi:hypothetical protein
MLYMTLQPIKYEFPFLSFTFLSVHEDVYSLTDIVCPLAYFAWLIWAG